MRLIDGDKLLADYNYGVRAELLAGRVCAGDYDLGTCETCKHKEIHIFEKTCGLHYTEWQEQSDNSPFEGRRHRNYRDCKVIKYCGLWEQDCD